MAIPRWLKLDPGTPLGTVVARLNDLLRSSDSIFVGGDRAHGSIDKDLSLTTNVLGTATIANKRAGVVASGYSHAYMETCDSAPGDNYTVVSGTTSITLSATGETGGKAWRQTGSVRLRFAYAVDFNKTLLYRFRARAKRISGSGTFSFGVECYDAAGASLGVVWTCVNAATPGTGAYDDYTGWVQGLGAPTAPATDATTPSPLPTGTVQVKPIVDLNGVTDLDLLSYDRHDEEASARTYNALLSPTLPADATRFATGARVVVDAVDEVAHQDDSVSTRVIAPDVQIVGRLENAGGTEFIDLRGGLSPGTTIVQLPGYSADNLGNATFDGEVAASSFTAPSATFDHDLTVSGDITITGDTDISGTTNLNGAVGVSGDAVFLGDATFGLGTVVTFNAGFSAASSTISGTLTSTGTLRHTGTLLAFYNGVAVGKHSNIADTSGAALAALETEVNALKALVRSYNLM